jgi:hypothetical protein
MTVHFVKEVRAITSLLRLRTPVKLTVYCLGAVQEKHRRKPRPQAG